MSGIIYKHNTIYIKSDIIGIINHYAAINRAQPNIIKTIL